MIANVTAGRALQALADLRDYVNSQVVKQPMQETVGSVDAANIAPQVSAADVTAAKIRSTDTELEHNDIFGLVRDFQYGQRSRRYLWQQGQQEKLRYGYELFMLFARENTLWDLNGIIAEAQDDPAILTDLTLADYQVTDFTA